MSITKKLSIGEVNEKNTPAILSFRISRRLQLLAEALPALLRQRYHQDCECDAQQNAAGRDVCEPFGAEQNHLSAALIEHPEQAAGCKNVHEEHQLPRPQLRLGGFPARLLLFTLDASDVRRDPMDRIVAARDPEDHRHSERVDELVQRNVQGHLRSDEAEEHAERQQEHSVDHQLVLLDDLATQLLDLFRMKRQLAHSILEILAHYTLLLDCGLFYEQSQNTIFNDICQRYPSYN
jgi:hypothetical protein